MYEDAENMGKGRDDLKQISWIYQTKKNFSEQIAVKNLKLKTYKKL
jgi:hypothetical protein